MGLIHVQVQCLLDKLEEREKAYSNLKGALAAKRDKYKGLFSDYQEALIVKTDEVNELRCKIKKLVGTGTMYN